MLKQSGFTLLEIMLVIAIIGILGGLSLPIYLNFQIRNDQDIAVSSLVSFLRQAHTRAVSGEEDSAWGVEIATNHITLFKGADFSVRDPSFDQVYTSTASITFSPTSEIIFVQLSGEPNITPTIIIQGATVSNKTVAINEKGVIDF